jgi:hypothetical protein
MKAILLGGEIVFPLAAVFSLYWYLIRPSRRGRGLTFDGMLWIAFLLAAPWDCLSAYTSNWFTYNSWLVNRGSVLSSLPGVLSVQQHGAGVAWSLLIIPPIYVALLPPMAWVGCWYLRALKRRFPQLGPARLVGLACLFACVADVVLEGLLFTRLGFYSFGGGHWLIGGGHYYQYPVHEGLLAIFAFAPFICLRYFVNDSGESFAERGSGRLSGGAFRTKLVRALAVIAVVHLGLLAYHVSASVVALHPGQWPKDVQDRSYFTNNICGPRVNRACPGPKTPLSSPGKPYLSYRCRLIVPEN